MTAPTARRVLVVAAHCAGTDHELTKVPDAAAALFDVLTDGERGGCIPVQLDGLAKAGYLDDPDIKTARETIKAALDACAGKGETLILAWLGHGYTVNDDFYLQPRNASFDAPTEDYFDLVGRIKDVLLGQKRALASLILLLDTCHSGGGAPGAADTWIRQLKGKLAFEVFTSTDKERVTYDCRFTNALVNVMRRGLAINGADHLYIHDLKPVVEQSYDGDRPQHINFSGTKLHDRLWLCRNYGRVGVDRALALADAAERACEADGPMPANFVAAVRRGVMACRAAGSDYTPAQAQAALLRAVDGNPLIAQKAWSDGSGGVGFSPDGRFVLTWNSREVVIADAITGEPLGEPFVHKDDVTWAKISADGRSIVVVSGELTLCVWKLEGRERVLGPLTFNPPHDAADGRRNWRIAASYDERPERVILTCVGWVMGIAYVCDLVTEQAITLGAPIAHSQSITSAAFSPDGRSVITTAWGGEAKIWDAQSGQQIGDTLRHGKVIHSAAFSPNGMKLVTASDDGTARIWEIEAAKGRTTALILSMSLEWKPVVKKEIRLVHLGPVMSARFSPDGKRVVTASEDTAARIWSAATGEELGPAMLHGETVDHAVFSADGRQVLSVSAGRSFVWQAIRPLATIHNGRARDEFVSTAIDAAGRVATVDRDGKLRFWDAEATSPTAPTLMPEGRARSVVFNPSSDYAVMVADGAEETASGNYRFNRSGELSLLPRSFAQIWDLRSLKPRGAAMAHEARIAQAVFSPDGRHVATASWDGTARVWDAASGAPIGLPLQHAWGVNALAFSEDGARLATASMDASNGRVFRYDVEVPGEWEHAPGAARIWDIATSRPLTAPMLHTGNVSSVAFSPDGTRLLSTCAAVAQVWDTTTGERIGAPLVHLEAILSACFDTGGDRIVTSSKDGTARLWRVSTGKPIAATLRHRSHAVYCARFSPDGRLVATGGGDGTARIWDAYTGRPLGEPMRHDFAMEDVQSVCFSSDGRHLFTSTPRGVWRWDLGWYQPKTVDAMLEKLRRTFPEAAAKITEADVLAAWPLVNEDIGKNVFEWLPD